MLFGSLIFLTALALLVILIYPLRLRIRYQRSEDSEHEISIMLRFRSGVRSGVRSGWEISLFRFSSQDRNKETKQGMVPSQPANKAAEEEQQDDPHLIKTPLHMLFNSINIFQTLFDDGSQQADQAEGHSLLKTLLYRVDTPLRFLQYARDCEAWSWETRLGTGDPASTAIVNGIIWGVKATAYSMLSRWVHFRAKPYFLVVPDYNKATLAVAFDGIFRFRLGQIILVETLAMLRKWKKGVGRFGVRQGTSH